MTGDTVVAALRQKVSMKTDKPIPPDWHLIKIDERRHWRPDIAAKATAIYTVYAFDKSSRTYLCESTPSYALWFIGHDAVPVEGLSDEEREKLDEDVLCAGCEEPGTYMHVNSIDLLCARHPELVRPVVLDDPEGDPENEIVEGWNTGALMF